MNKYHITTIDHDGNMQDEIRDSFTAFDAVEEWFFENEGKTDDIKKLTVEFVRRVS